MHLPIPSNLYIHRLGRYILYNLSYYVKHAVISTIIPLIIMFMSIMLFSRDAVDAKGYQDPGVNSLRDWLSAFIISRRSPSGNFSLPIQFASVTALLGLIERSFREITEEANVDIISRPGNQSNAINCIRNWFSSLDTEQKSSFWHLNSVLPKESSAVNPKV